MAQAQFPEPKDLDVPFKDRIGDGTSLNLNPYTVSNPHPGYGKDPNILNEYGHSVYPKKITSNITGKREIVNSAMEEAQHTSGNAVKSELEVKKEPKGKDKAPAWPNAK
jgi:hypothetical protein